MHKAQLLAPKPHFFAALAMFMLIAWMAVEESKFTRGLLIAPIFALFFAMLVLYGIEIDSIVRQRTGGKESHPNQ